MSLNKMFLIGRLGSDPELRYTQSGTAVANFNLATNSMWKDKAGNRQEKVCWHRIVVWGKSAENCQKYLTKGRQIYVEGEIECRSWQTKKGEDRTTVEIKAKDVQFLGGDKTNSSDQSATPAAARAQMDAQEDVGFTGEHTEEMPF